MSSIQAYKAHKQEGTLASKVHKQGALDRHIFPSIPTLTTKQFFSIFVTLN